MAAEGAEEAEDTDRPDRSKHRKGQITVFAEKEYPHKELTGRIITAAMKVHSVLGPGYLERIYENALMRELADMGLKAQRQLRCTVNYQGYPVGEHVLDIVVEGKVYVELKCQRLTGLETAQVLSGLKAGRLKVGLLINFNTAHLRNGIQRVVLPEAYLERRG